jgi:hypothetical protein
LRSKTVFVLGRTILRIMWSSSEAAMLVTATKAALYTNINVVVVIVTQLFYR